MGHGNNFPHSQFSFSNLRVIYRHLITFGNVNLCNMVVIELKSKNPFRKTEGAEKFKRNN